MVNDVQFVTVKVPIELLFHENIYDMGQPNKHGKKTEAWVEQHLKYGNSSIMRLWPHIKLFRYLNGEPNETPDDYLSWYEYGFNTRNRLPRFSRTGILNRRINQYNLLKKELETDSDYFYQNPIEVLYNPKGYFNLDDGHHRAVFLYTQGEKNIYARMKKTDYDNWINKDEVKNLSTYLKSKGVQEFETPLLNPSFHSVIVKRNLSTRFRLECILNYLEEKNLKGTNIIDIGCEEGYFSRQFVREGANVVGIEPKKEKCDLVKLINNLEKVNFLLINRNFANAELQIFDIGMKLNSFCFRTEKRSSIDAFLKQINKTIKHLLFWEFESDKEYEKKLILENTFFTRYEKLCDTKEEGKKRELGVFL